MSRRRLGRHPFSTHQGPAPTAAGFLALALVDETALGEAADLCAQLGIPAAYARQVAAAVAVCPTLPRSEPADPVTAEEAQEILALFAHDCHHPATCDVDAIREAFVSDFVNGLPDVGPAVIGQVVIDAAGAVGQVVKHLRTTMPVDSDPTALAVNLLAAAGAQLYLGATHPDPLAPAKEA